MSNHLPTAVPLNGSTEPHHWSEERSRRAAAYIVERGLEVPLLFFMEAHLPFVTIFHTLGLLLEPLSVPFFGTERVYALRELLADRKAVERLVADIEEQQRMVSR